MLSDNVGYPGEVTNIKEDIQVNVKVPTGKQTWKWPKYIDCIFDQSKNTESYHIEISIILKKISPPETSSGASGHTMLQF